ncbi:VOC family protein [Micromonospora sp. CPCC 206060]|uniref:VOC family protein n=1 Tax=Micromonospora sp. CPCC 206060 TaxID=3122406 RepID=UPI002FF17872
MSTVEAGTPCWVDLATGDLDTATRFYPELFGWTGQVSPDPESDGYTIFQRNGLAVAGAGPPATPGQPAIWSTYIASDDVDSAAGRVEAAGGQVIVDPFDIGEQGRMAVFADPAGAAFSVWQPRAMRGAELFGEPGALSWNELTTPDPAGAKEFYALVFGWQPEDQPMGTVTYTGWRLGDRIVAGMMPALDEHWPPNLPAYWGVYFAVADCDATAARAAELGGIIMVPPRDIPMGRYAVLNDPQGAAFSVIALAPPD